MLSQTASIGQNNTTILDEEKTIDVAKIIENEKRLRKYVDSLHADLNRLNDSIQKTNVRNQELIAELLIFKEMNRDLSDQISRLKTQQLEAEKTKRAYGVYITDIIGSDFQNEFQNIVGVHYVRRKMSYFAGIDPFKNESLQKEINFYLGASINIF